MWLIYKNVWLIYLICSGLRKAWFRDSYFGVSPILLISSKISNMAYRRENIRDENDVFHKIRNVFASLNDKL